MKRLLGSAIFFLLTTTASAQTVRIVQKPQGLVHGMLFVPIVATDPVARIKLLINNVKYTEAAGKTMTAQVNIGEYIRRLRFRPVGYDASGNVAGEDDMVVDDPRPPFRVTLSAPAKLPDSGEATLSANVLAPVETHVQSVDFFIGEKKVGTVAAAPYKIAVDASQYPHAAYARVTAHAADGEEANDVDSSATGPTRS